MQDEFTSPFLVGVENTGRRKWEASIIINNNNYNNNNNNNNNSSFVWRRMHSVRDASVLRLMLS